MSIFCLKKIQKPTMVSQKLKTARQKLGLSLADLTIKTKIDRKYLLAIEKNHPENLPEAKILKTSYIKKYAQVVGLDPIKTCQHFCYETNLNNSLINHPNKKLKIKKLSSIAFWFRRLGIAILACLFLSYFVWQITGIMQAPNLTIYNPTDGHLANKMKILIQGKTDKEVSLTINGKEININEWGNFEKPIDLSPGINELIITATKKHGKQTTITRHVIVKDSVVNQDKISVNN